MAPMTNAAVTRGPRSIAAASAGNETGERESLANVISRIDPDDTPLYSNLPKTGGKAIYEEWLCAELEAVTSTAISEAAAYAPGTSKQMDRLGNYMTIRKAEKFVSGTFDAVNTAGRNRETQRQRVLAGINLRQQINYALYGNTAYSGADPRQLGGFPAYVGNMIGGASYNAGGWNGTHIITPGTGRSFTSGADLLDVLQGAYENGGDPSQLYMTAGLKRQFSKLTDVSVASFQANIDGRGTRREELTFYGAVDAMRHDWGFSQVIVDRNRGTYGTNLVYILCLDPKHAEIRFLPGRNMTDLDIGKTGDATPISILSEFTLVIDAPKAHGIAGDYTSTTKKAAAGFGTTVGLMGADTLAEGSDGESEAAAAGASAAAVPSGKAKGKAKNGDEAHDSF